MNKIIMSNLDEEIYHEVLDNGLNVFIYKKEGYLKKGAYFATDYGSAVINFKPIGENKMHLFPTGIAHFLEHKLFESNDDEKTFEKFSKYGAYLNAYTSHFVTNYYFSTSNHFEECLEELIDLVQTPCFTNENVEKEKGIIFEEINMTGDRIDRFLFEESFNAILKNNPNKYLTIGSKEDVGRITKEDLYRCYNTFYHPSNMVLSIYGDVDVDKVMNLIKVNQAGKEFPLKEEIVKKEYTEPKSVSYDYKEFKRNSTNNQVGICYKIKTPFLKGEDKFEINLFADLLLDLKFGGTSSFEKDLLLKDIIKTRIDFSYIYFDDVLLLYVKSDVSDKDEFVKVIDYKLKIDDFDKKLFDLDKRSLKTQLIKMFENPSSVGDYVFNSYLSYGKVLNNIYDIYDKYTFDKFKEQFNNMDFNNKSVLYIPKSKK